MYVMKLNDKLHLCGMETPKFWSKQGVTVTGRNRTGPPCSVGRSTAHTPGRGAPIVHAHGRRLADRRQRSHAAVRPARRQR